MLTVLIPMAGSGKRFAEAGYTDPKPLIPLIPTGPRAGRMIDAVLWSLTSGLFGVPYRVVFVVRESRVAGYVADLLPVPTHVILLTGPTEGAACTCLLAKDHIDNGEPLLIANCDQLVPPEAVRALVSTGDLHAILTMKGDGSKKWSYAQVENGHVLSVEEKNPISDRATCGLYYFKYGNEFVTRAEHMISRGDRTNGEFYVAPVFNYTWGSITEVRVEDHGDGKFHGLGTPEDLRSYLGQ